MSNKIQNSLISVIIPCFNDVEYLYETLASINSQSYENIEIIVVDDASDDPKTLQVLSSLQQDNLKVIVLEQNSGPSVARNKGIALAKGAYILPVDADDKIYPTYIEKAKKILDENADTGIVYCEAELFGEKTGKWDLPEYAFPDILVANMIFATALFRKEDWKTVGGYNENMKKGNEDYDFWLSLLELGQKVYRIPETLFSYRIKNASRTSRLAENKENEVNSYMQLFKNHETMYVENIEIFLKELKKKQLLLFKKDHEIRKVHQKLQKQDIEITTLYGELHQNRKKLLNTRKMLEQTGEELSYARSVVEYRDKQLEQVVEFWQRTTEALRVKNRLKRFVKNRIPESILRIFGIQRDEPICMVELEAPQLPVKKYLGYRYNIPVLNEEIQDRLKIFVLQPLISIIMPVYNVDPEWLDKAIRSIEKQWYENWELCIADDKSSKRETLKYLNNIKNPKIKVTYLQENMNISGATNEALKLAKGEYIALMDNDDEITSDALYEMVKAINEEDAEFIYSDEDFISVDGECSNPHFKPDFSPDLLLSHNYITHFSCFKKSLLDEVGHFNAVFDGSQDYDLFLRLTEKTTKIYHIQKVLYHWRTIEGSTSADSEAKPEAIERGRKVLQAALERRGIRGIVEHGNLHHYFRVRYAIEDNPLVSIVIPFKDKPELLDMCINSILEKSTYQNYEIIGISNNSEDTETFAMMKILEAKDKRVVFYEYNTEFNYADINNHAVNTYTRGEHVLLLNNDIEVITPDWIEAMLEHSQRENVGCVGAKLYFPNDTVQHAGVIIGLGGYAGHSHKMYDRENPGYFNRLSVVQNVSAVTAACLMIKKRIYQEIGGMDEVKFKVAYNDVDFCLRVVEEGYANIFTPYSEMYHHESISRGYETTPEKMARFKTEKDALFERHRDILENGDPYYNPNLTHDREDFSLCTSV